MRNPKDLVVSFLHHCRLMRNQDFVGTIEEFVQYFVDGDREYLSTRSVCNKEVFTYYLINFKCTIIT